LSAQQGVRFHGGIIKPVVNRIRAKEVFKFRSLGLVRVVNRGKPEPDFSDGDQRQEDSLRSQSPELLT
jgi:hypothetical protein